MQRDRIATARLWLGNASSDIALATDIATRFPARACFHAQQASEFALKAALIAVSDDHQRTHVADALAADLVRLGESVPNDVIVAANRLDLYYMGSRYPDALGGGDPLKVLQESDANSAIDQAKLVVTFCANLIQRLDDLSASP